MIYSIRIGVAEPTQTRGTREVKLTAVRYESDGAPVFEGDPTGKKNERIVSISAWADFCERAGLVDLMRGELGLMRHVPGCFWFGRNEQQVIKQAFKKYRGEHSDITPGWPKQDPGEPEDLFLTRLNESATLARLIWLDYWATFTLSLVAERERARRADALYTSRAEARPAPALAVISTEIAGSKEKG